MAWVAQSDTGLLMWSPHNESSKHNRWARMFDPYRKWLGIPPKDQPPNHYRLLGLELFESDADLIEGAADKQMNHVRQYQSGKYATEAAKLLNELAKARLCLLKPATKKAYDAELKSQQKWKPKALNQQVLVATATGVVLLAAVLSIWRSLNPPIEKPNRPVYAKRPESSQPINVASTVTPKPAPVVPQTPPPPPEPVIPTEKAEIVRTWQGSLGRSQEGVFSNDGSRIVFVSGNDIIIADTMTGENELKLSGHDKQVWTARFSGDNKYVVSFAQDATIRRWDLQTGGVIAQQRTSSSDSGSVLVSSVDGSRIAFSSDNDHRLDVTNVRLSGTSYQTSMPDPNRWFRAVAPDLNQRLDNGFRNESLISTVDPSSHISLDDGHHNYCGQITRDGQHALLAGGCDWDLWNIPTKTKLKEGSVIGGHIYAIATTPTMDRIVMGLADGKVWYWNGETEKRLDSTRDHEKPVNSVMLSPDGKLVVSHDDSGTILLRRLPN